MRRIEHRKMTEDNTKHWFVELVAKCGLENLPPDDDGLYDGRVLPPSHSRIFMCLAWISFLTGTYAATMGYYDLSAIPLGVWLTSMNYWRRPILYSWRRYFDLSFVNIALIYQLYRARLAENMMGYYAVIGITLFFFHYLGISIIVN